MWLCTCFEKYLSSFCVALRCFLTVLSDAAVVPCCVSWCIAKGFISVSHKYRVCLYRQGWVWSPLYVSGICHRITPCSSSQHTGKVAWFFFHLKFHLLLLTVWLYRHGMNIVHERLMVHRVGITHQCTLAPVLIIITFHSARTCNFLSLNI